MNGYVETFTVKDRDKYKNKKLMSFYVDDDKLLEKYKTIQTKIEDIKNIELNVLPVYNNRHVRAKIKTYDDNVYTNFCRLNVLEDYLACESVTIISIELLLVHKSKYYTCKYISTYVLIKLQTTI